MQQEKTQGPSNGKIKAAAPNGWKEVTVHWQETPNATENDLSAADMLPKQVKL